MASLLWDASALVKRYAQEDGSETVQALFGMEPRWTMCVTVPGYVETYSILLRRHNGGVITRRSFDTAVAALRNEILLDTRVQLVSVDDSAFFAGIEAMRRNNINSSDAAILTAFLRFSESTPDQPCVLVSSDKRLVRAGIAEGLQSLNPEDVSVSRLASFLAP